MRRVRKIDPGDRCGRVARGVSILASSGRGVMAMVARLGRSFERRALPSWLRFLPLCALVAAVLPGEVRAHVRRADGHIVPADFFGIHVHDWVALSRLPASMPLWRAWDARVTWPDLEPTPGTWQADRLASLVHAARQKRARLILPLAMVPPWASGGPRLSNAYGPGRGGPVANLAAWDRYVTRMAEVAAREGADLELWNEPDLPDFCQMSPEDLAALARRTRRVLNEAWPRVRLVGPAVTLRHGMPWLSRFLVAGGGEALDALTIHAYVTPDGPEALWPALDGLQALLRRLGAEMKPIWCTEVGWRIASDEYVVAPLERTSFARVLSDREATDVLQKTCLTLAARGVARVCWYSWDHRDMGLAEAGSGAPKAVGQAWLRLASWLPGKRIALVKDSSDTAWTFRIGDAKGLSREVLWRPGEVLRGLDPIQ